MAKQSRKKGTPSAPLPPLQSLSISEEGKAHDSSNSVPDATINSIPDDALGRTLDFLSLSGVLTLTRLVQKGLGRGAARNVSHLNIMQASELYAPIDADSFPSVKSINHLSLLTAFELPDEHSSPSEATFIINKRAISGSVTFLKQFKGLRRVYIGGHCNGSICAYDPSRCRGPENQRGLVQRLFGNFVVAFSDGEFPKDLCLEGLTHANFCSNEPDRPAEPCALCSKVGSTFPLEYVQEFLVKNVGSTDATRCLSTPNTLRCIESRPDGGVDLALAQIPRILHQLISDGAVRRYVVSSTRTRSSCTNRTEFIDWAREEGSGNDGRKQAIFWLEGSARSVLEKLFEYYPASRSIAANAIVKSVRSSMRGDGATGKIVFHGMDLDFLVDEEGFGLDRKEFIALDGLTFRTILSEQRNRVDRPTDLPTHIYF